MFQTFPSLEGEIQVARATGMYLAAGPSPVPPLRRKLEMGSSCFGSEKRTDSKDHGQEWPDRQPDSFLDHPTPAPSVCGTPKSVAEASPFEPMPTPASQKKLNENQKETAPRPAGGSMKYDNIYHQISGCILYIACSKIMFYVALALPFLYGCLRMRRYFTKCTKQGEPVASKEAMKLWQSDDGRHLGNKICMKIHFQFISPPPTGTMFL